MNRYQLWLGSAMVAALGLYCIGMDTLLTQRAADIAALPIAHAQTAEGYPVVVRQYNSRKEQEDFVYNNPPRRVVAVWQNSIETLIALGEGEQIIAAIGIPDKKYLRDEYQDAYTRIEYQSDRVPDLETALMMHPDFILGWYSTFGPKYLRGSDFWKDRGINTYIAESSIPVGMKGKHHTLEEEYRYIEDMGRIFGKSEQAHRMVQGVQDHIAAVRAYAAERQTRPKALVIEWMGKEIRVYGESTLAGQMVKRVDGELLAADLERIGEEEMRVLDPDVIFLVVTETLYGSEQMLVQRLVHHPALKNMRCVKEGRIHTLPLNAVYSPGVRVQDGVEMIAAALYPEMAGQERGNE